MAQRHTALDALTVGLPHPDTTAALLSGAGDITAHFSSSPFQHRIINAGKGHKVISSYEVPGGPVTSNILNTRAQFRKDNPKTYAALPAAVKEAVTWINGNKAAAAETYIRVERSKLGQLRSLPREAVSRRGLALTRGRIRGLRR